MAPFGGFFSEHPPALKMALDLGPDVVFFLTDSDDISARDVEQAMQLNHDNARIHTIRFGLGPESSETTRLSELARSTGGKYLYVDTGKLQPK